MGAITQCRVCHSDRITEILDFGRPRLHRGLPRHPRRGGRPGRVSLLVCESCGLVQLGDTFPLEEMYGDNYGYRSGLNASMVSHLGADRRSAGARPACAPAIASSTSAPTTAPCCARYQTEGLRPHRHRPDDREVPRVLPGRHRHDLRRRLLHRRGVRLGVRREAREGRHVDRDVLRPRGPGRVRARHPRPSSTDDGVWYFEQSYMPWMLRSGAYDTICHEHLEYYSLTTIKRILDDAGLMTSSTRPRTRSTGDRSRSRRPGRMARGRARPSIPHWLLEQERRDRVHEPETLGRVPAEGHAPGRRTSLAAHRSCVTVGGKRSWPSAPPRRATC